MSHSINHQFIHFLWPTKNLSPLIIENSQAPLLRYLTGIMRRLGGQLLASSATSNHLHLLAKTPTDLSIADLLRQVKSCSSKWYRAQDYQSSHLPFGWNEGYSAFTVSPSSVNNVMKYLAAEEHRHQNLSFEDELMGFLKMQEIDFDHKFLTNTTHTKLIYHLVWSVKNREPLLDASLQAPLHERIGQWLQQNGCVLHAVGNVADHIHLLVECTSSITTASLVQNLKTVTNHWIKLQDRRKFACFSWQEGYGSFSVGKPAFRAVSSYVNNQENHHRISSSEQEWKWLAEMNGVFQ